MIGVTLVIMILLVLASLYFILVILIRKKRSDDIFLVRWILEHATWVTGNGIACEVLGQSQVGPRLVSAKFSPQDGVIAIDIPRDWPPGVHGDPSLLFTISGELSPSDGIPGNAFVFSVSAYMRDGTFVEQGEVSYDIRETSSDGTTRIHKGVLLDKETLGFGARLACILRNTEERIAEYTRTRPTTP